MAGLARLNTYGSAATAAPALACTHVRHRPTHHTRIHQALGAMCSSHKHACTHLGLELLPSLTVFFFRIHM